MFKIELNPVVELQTLSEGEQFSYARAPTSIVYTYFASNSSVAFIGYGSPTTITTACLTAKVIRVNPLPVFYADLPLGAAFRCISHTNLDQVYVKTGPETAMYESNSTVDFVGMNLGTKVKPVGKLVGHVEGNH